VAENPLIDARALHARLGEPKWIAVDCRFSLQEPTAGRAAYERGHIPGARYADLDRDLSRAPRPGDGRHPLPDPAVFAGSLGAWGIAPGDTVVAYDEGSGAIAARLWWLLRFIGHADTRVLDGGLAAWQAALLPLETTSPSWQTTRYPAPTAVPMTAVVTADELPDRQAAGDVLVDARGAARYRGEQEPIDPVAGHVPGARNWPFSNNVTASGTFRPAAELKSDLLGLLDGAQPQRLIAMCGSGVTACHVLLALAVAGLPAGKLYAGSWSEWIRDPKRAVKTGPEP
jgi:thiosulfate/3-mercaptopyruvate sulfurtransferase